MAKRDKLNMRRLLINSSLSALLVTQLLAESEENGWMNVVNRYSCRVGDCGFLACGLSYLFCIGQAKKVRRRMKRSAHIKV